MYKAVTCFINILLWKKKIHLLSILSKFPPNTSGKQNEKDLKHNVNVANESVSIFSIAKY